MHLVLAAVLVTLALTAAIVPVLVLSLDEPGWRKRWAHRGSADLARRTVPPMRRSPVDADHRRHDEGARILVGPRQ